MQTLQRGLKEENKITKIHILEALSMRFPPDFSTDTHTHTDHAVQTCVPCAS